MATPAYPATLPGPSTYRMTPGVQLALTDNAFGPQAARRRSRQPTAIATVTFEYLEDDYRAFVAWWKDVLLYGHRWFTLVLPSAAGFEPHVVSFLKKYRAVKSGYRRMSVSAEIEIRDRLFAPAVALPEYAFFEGFEDGFSAYSATSGDTSIYTLREGMTGNHMHCAPQSSGSVAEIARTFEPVACTFLSFRFRVTIANTDDGCILALRNGMTNVFAFNPIRETFFDASRRARIYLPSELIVAPAGVVIGEIYRAELQLSPAPGGSTFTLTRETTGAVLGSTTIPGAYPPFTFDTLAFRMDSGGTTSETDYDDIYAN